MRATALALAAVLLTVMYASWTAGRLDRLHARVDAAWAALDAALLRRAAAACAVAPLLHGREPAARLMAAATAALVGGPVAREAVENDLSQALRAALDVLPPPDATPPGDAARAELDAASVRVALARSIHNSAVTDARRIRVRRLPRALRLAGHRAVPQHFDIDDAAPAAGLAQPGPGLAAKGPQGSR